MRILFLFVSEYCADISSWYVSYPPRQTGSTSEYLDSLQVSGSPSSVYLHITCSMSSDYFEIHLAVYVSQSILDIRHDYMTGLVVLTVLDD